MSSALFDPHKATVRAQFGGVADQYATSEIHASGTSLKVLIAEVQPQPSWTVLDVATGTGRAGFAFAGRVDQVIAVDFTEPMLHQTRVGAAARGLNNVRAVDAEAEHLPFAAGTRGTSRCGKPRSLPGSPVRTRHRNRVPERQ